MFSRNIDSLEALDKFSQELALEIQQSLRDDKDLVILLKASMAGGKTTLINSLAIALRVEETVTSPSFAGIHQYSFDLDDAPVIFYHLDLYQMNLDLDAFLELMNQEERLFFTIEWSEKISDEILRFFTKKKDHIRVLDLSIENLDDDQRLIRISDQNV